MRVYLWELKVSFIVFLHVHNASSDYSDNTQLEGITRLFASKVRFLDLTLERLVHFPNLGLACSNLGPPVHGSETRTMINQTEQEASSRQFTSFQNRP